MQEWKIGFTVKYVASTLSHQSRVNVDVETFNSYNNDFNQINFVDAFATDWYFTSVEDRAILCYFLANHKTRLLPINTKYQPVILAATQSVSTYANNYEEGDSDL